MSATPLDGVGLPVTQMPSNVQSLTAKDIAVQRPSNLADLLDANVGAVSVSNSVGNPYQNDVSYRGFQATSLLGAPVGLSVYLDGVRMNEPFGSIVNWDLIPMNAISSINLLPGSNPMFGMNTLGGALSLNTKNGKEDPGTSLTAIGGSFHRRGLQFETGWRDDAHRTDYFVAGNWDKQDGYREHSGSEVRQLFGKARWDGGATRGELWFALADNMLYGTQSLPVSMLSNPTSAYTWPDSIANRMALINLELSHQISDDSSLIGNVYYRKTRSASVNSNASYDNGCTNVINGVNQCYQSLTNGTAINSLGANALGLANYTGDVNTSLINSTTRQDTFGSNLQWTRLGKLAGRDNSLTMGAIAEYSRIAYDQDTVLARLVNQQIIATPNLRYFFPGTGGATGSPLLNSVNVRGDTGNYSVFLTDTLELSDIFSVTASGSFNLTTVRQTGARSQFLGDDGAFSWTDAVSGVGYFNPSYVGAQYYSGSTLTTINSAATAGLNAGPQVSGLDGNHVYRRFNPALGFAYNPSRAIGFFGGYSEAMRAPTAIELSCANPNAPCALPTGFNGDPDLKPVIARTFELGARGRSEGGTVWSVAAYDTRLDNDIQFVASSNSTVTGYFTNVGQTERRGVDLGISHKFSRLFLAASYGYVSATYRSPWTNSNGDTVPAGATIPGIPAQTLKLRATYDVTPTFQAGGNLLLVAGQYAHGDEPNQQPMVPGYALLNLDLNLRLSDNWTAFGLVRNVFDRPYATYGVMGTNIYNGTSEQFRTPAAGRAVWLGLNYAFGGKRRARDD